MTAIEWTEKTWNPVTGCDRVSPGCAHCYALDLAARLKRMGQPRYQRDGDPRTSGPGFGVTLHPDKLEEPLRWWKSRRVFVNSMSDLFHEEIPDDYIARVFAVMADAPRHTFQVLTKRPERAKKLLGGAWIQNEVDEWTQAGIFSGTPWPLPNVWLGVSIENRRFVHRADLLRETPAAVRFISAEPLLGPLVSRLGGWPDGFHGPELLLHDIDWLIVGGESGARHRPMRVEWVRDLRDACLDQRAYPTAVEVHAQPMLAHARREGLERRTTAFFFKQWGGRTPKSGGRELDGRTWDEYPDRQAQGVLL